MGSCPRALVINGSLRHRKSYARLTNLTLPLAKFSRSCFVFTKTALLSANDQFQEFFHVYYICGNNTLHSNCRSSTECKKIIPFNSHLVTDPDFIAHFLNICILLLRL